MHLTGTSDAVTYAVPPLALVRPILLPVRGLSPSPGVRVGCRARSRRHAPQRTMVSSVTGMQSEQPEKRWDKY